MGLYGNSLSLFQAAWNGTAWLWPEGSISMIVHSIKVIDPELSAKSLNFPSWGCLCGFLGLPSSMEAASRAEHSEKAWWKCMTFFMTYLQKSHNITSLEIYCLRNTKVILLEECVEWEILLQLFLGRGDQNSLLQLVLVKSLPVYGSPASHLLPFKNLHIWLCHLYMCFVYWEY